MASGKGNTLSNALLDHVLGGPDYARPATVYVALFTTAPTAAGGGVEVSGTDYARKAVTNNDTNFPAASNQAKRNGADIDFGVAGAGGWGTIVAAAIMTQASGGDLLYWGTLAASKTVNAGDGFKITPNNLTITEA